MCARLYAIRCKSLIIRGARQVGKRHWFEILLRLISIKLYSIWKNSKVWQRFFICKLARLSSAYLDYRDNKICYPLCSKLAWSHNQAKSLKEFFSRKINNAKCCRWQIWIFNWWTLYIVQFIMYLNSNLRLNINQVGNNGSRSTQLGPQESLRITGGFFYVSLGGAAAPGGVNGSKLQSRDQCKKSIRFRINGIFCFKRILR